ncbi:hypothetical protein KIPB_009453, partial [Kipferlia bialata]
EYCMADPVSPWAMDRDTFQKEYGPTSTRPLPFMVAKPTFHTEVKEAVRPLLERLRRCSNPLQPGREKDVVHQKVQMLKRQATERLKQEERQIRSEIRHAKLLGREPNIPRPPNPDIDCESESDNM